MNNTWRSIAGILAVLLLGPLVVLYVTQVIWLDSLTAPLAWMTGHLGAAALFWLLFTALTLVVYGFTRRFVWAYLPWTLVCLLLAYISRVKMNINGAPLQLSDFSLAAGVGDLAEYASSQLAPSPAALGGILLALGLLALLFWQRKALRVPWIVAMSMGVLGLSLTALACVPGLVQSAALELDENCYDQTARCDQQGVVLGLYTAWCQRVQQGQTDQEALVLAERFLEESAQAQEPLALEAAPDIIFVASEAFFDITRLPGLTWEEDPLPNFHALAETCTNGRFLSNTYGGGTGWVEMELFTGLSASLLREGDTLSTLAPEVYEQLPTTVRLLNRLGYATTAVHAHTDKLYERATVYPAIGFEEVAFRKDFVTARHDKGGYTSDESFAQELLARYEARDPSRPLFLYGLSMQNHQPYYAQRYEEPSGFPVACEGLEGEDLAAVDSLVMGLHDADASLGTLIDYFSQVDRPVMLVFLGDHLPSMNLAAGDTLYARLGVCPGADQGAWTPQVWGEMYATDYLIWSNYEGEPVPDRTESCTFLGLHLLERAGIPLDGYFSWLQSGIAREMLLTQNRVFADAQGIPTYEVPLTARQPLDQYESLQQAMVYGLWED